MCVAYVILNIIYVSMHMECVIMLMFFNKNFLKIWIPMDYNGLSSMCIHILVSQLELWENTALQI